MDSENKKPEREFALMSPDDRALALAKEGSVFLNVAKYEQTQRVASMLAKSRFIPSNFQNNIADCMVALDLADRMRMHPLMLMQSMYVIKGRPGFEGKFCSALVNGSGRYEDPLEYEWKGAQGNPDWGCRAYATRKSTGKVVRGPWVDWKMVNAEGWNKPKGTETSKWVTMPEVMFMYRSASFFLKTNDSDLMMGMQTIEELEDVAADLIQRPDGTFTTGDQTERTPDMYAVNQQSKGVKDNAGEAADGTDQVKETAEPQSAGKDAAGVKVQDEAGKEDAAEPEKADPATKQEDRQAVVSEEWSAWETAKAPGMKHLAEEHKDTFANQPIDFKVGFQNKWERLEGLKALAFPFDGSGNWIGYEPDPRREAPKDEPPQESLNEVLERFNEVWVGGNVKAKSQASKSMGLPIDKRPENTDIRTWLTYYDACLKKIESGQRVQDKIIDGDPMGVGDGTPFDDSEQF